jgi:hypothetical protein
LCNNDELRVSGHLYDLISKASNVRFVKWRVDLIEQTERRRPVVEDFRTKAKAAIAFHHPTKAAHSVIVSRAAERSHDPDSKTSSVSIGSSHLSAQQLTEQFTEVLVDLLESVAETFAWRRLISRNASSVDEMPSMMSCR